MKLILSLLFILLITSCGKKSEGSRPGVSPLLPAPVTTMDTEDVMLSMLDELGLRVEFSSHLQNNPAVIVCVNTEFTQAEKIEGLKNYFVTINDEEVPTKMPKKVLNALIPKAVELLSAASPDSKKCPKIFLAIE